MIALDRVCDVLATLHHGLDELSKYLEDSLAGACVLLLGDGSGDIVKLGSSEVVLPIPLLKIHNLRFWQKWFDFDRRVVRFVREAGGRW